MRQDAGTTESVSAVAPAMAGPNRSRLGSLVLVPAMVVMLAALVAATWYVHRTVTDPVALTYWWLGAGALSCCGYALVRRRRTRHLPAGPRRTVAIVVSREQEVDDLHACIWSILHQRAVIVDEVHVVDDGSVHRPVQPFSHRRVRWHRMERGGRRAAQAYVLDRLEPDGWEFVLMVDGDSVLEERALEHQLRAFSRSRVTATVGMRIVRDAQRHFLNRITEVHIGTTYARRQAYAPLSGPPETVAGAPTVHRAAFLFQHKHCHLTSGVVGVGESVAWTRAPAQAETAFQRLRRRSETGSCLHPPALIGTRRLRGIPLRLLTLVPLLTGPLTIGYALLAVPDLRWSMITAYVALFLLMRYAASSLHFIDQPAAGRRAKLWAWLVLTPAETALDLLIIVPMKYAVLFTRGGRRREDGPENRHDSLSAAPLPAPGTVYFSGQQPDEPIMTAAAPVLVAAVRTSGGADLSDDREVSHD